MQNVAEKTVSDEQVSKVSGADSDAARADKSTAKQIADIENALKGKSDFSGNAAGDAADAVIAAKSDGEEKPKNENVDSVSKPTKDKPTKLSAETGAALQRFESLLKGSAGRKARLFKDAPKNDDFKVSEEKKPADATKNEKIAKKPVVLSPSLLSPSKASEPSDKQEASEADYVEVESVDTKVDFFSLRRSLRQLQFNYSINKPHDDSIKDEFDELLAAFSKMSVQYQMMAEDHAKSMDERNQLVRVRCDLRDVHADLRKAEQTAKNADLRRTKDLEAFAQLTARQNATRAELKESQESIDALKQEMADQAKDFESRHEENSRLTHEVSLAEAEKSVLRESLSEACDKIAELMSSEMRFENMIQHLEDEVASLRAGTSSSPLSEFDQEAFEEDAKDDLEAGYDDDIEKAS